jgi:beta-glucosidase
MVKYAFGLFDKPRPSERYWSDHPSFGSKVHRALARDAVRKSLVLLKNEESLLPLNKNDRILVAGKSAHDRGNLCGGFSLAWQGQSGNEHIPDATSIWEGIRQAAPNAVLSTANFGEDADPAAHDFAIVVMRRSPHRRSRLPDQGQHGCTRTLWKQP